MAILDNVAGHRARLEFLKKRLTSEKVGYAYVGGGDQADQVLIGYQEEEVIRRHATLEGAYVIDVGCGIGRLTGYLLQSPVKRYLGVDILPEILSEAEKLAGGRQGFRFGIAEDCLLPEEDGQAEIVCGFSLITHLLDDEVAVYFREAARVLRGGGVAVFSFLDFSHPSHLRRFEQSLGSYRVKRDLLKFFEKETLRTFSRLAGLHCVDIVDAETAMKTSGARTSLLDGRSVPAEISFNQSVIYLRKPE